MSFRTNLAALFRADEPTRLDLRSAGNILEQGTTNLSSPAAFAAVFPSSDTSSGEPISESTALNVSTVFTCVRIIAENMGAMPLKVKENTGTGIRIADDHSLAVLFNAAPNCDMGARVFIETVVTNMAMTGNGYAEIIRDPDTGAVLELYPRSSFITRPERLTDGTIGYVIREGNGADEKKRVVRGKDMLHFRLFGLDGLLGVSPIGAQRASLGLTLAAQKHGSRYFGNGTRPGGLLTLKGQLPGAGVGAQGQQLKNFKDDWEAAQGGINQGRIAVLPSDWSYTPIGMSLEDSQFLETRAFQRAEIASWFRIPLNMVGDATRMSNSNHEQSSLSLIQDCLAPYIAKIEEELLLKLLPPTGRIASRFSLRFDLTERLKSDYKTTLDAIALARQWGVMTSNEGRAILGMNPLGPEADILYAPVNMMDAVSFAEWSANLAAPPKPSAPVVVAPHLPPEAPGPKIVPEQKSYLGLIRDSVGRISHRSSRDSEAFMQVFSPTLQAMAAGLTEEARTAFNLPSDWSPNTPKLLSDGLKSLEHRSASWGTDLEATAQDETARIHKALRVNIFREAGAALALKDLPDVA